MTEKFKAGVLKQRGNDRGVVGADEVVLYLGLHHAGTVEPQALTPWTVTEARELRDWLNVVLPSHEPGENQ